MMILFWIIIAIMTLVAMAFVLVPLFRHRETKAISRDQANIDVYQNQLQSLEKDLDEGNIDPQSYKQLHTELERGLLSDVNNNISKTTFITVKPSFVTAIFLAIFIPAFSIPFYMHWGDSPQLKTYFVEKENAKAIKAEIAKFKSPQQIVAKMQQMLKEHPNSAKGWFLLGRLYSSLNEYTKAESAYGKADTLKPKDPKIMLQFAQASFFVNNKKLNKKAKQYVDYVLQKEPQNPSVINLLALNAYTSKHYQQAINYWEKLLPLFPPNTNDGKAIMEAINKAQQKLSKT